jgi:tripartite-type tricarboxylate transporter receptor subunit TctC
VVGRAPGAGTDLVARSVGQKLSGSLGQSDVVNNRTGAVGSIRAGIVVKSPPDGYTVLILCEQLLDYPSFYQRLPFDPVKDLTPITLSAEAPFLVMVNPGSRRR